MAIAIEELPDLTITTRAAVLEEQQQEKVVPVPIYALLDIQKNTVTFMSSLDVSTTAADVEQKFRRLADQWRNETMFSSSSTDRLSHDAYLKIIGMGHPVVPLMLRELEQRGGHWFLALHVITEADPVRPEDIGNIKKMKEAWLQWGRQNHYL